jgi:RecA-family ATPase
VSAVVNFPGPKAPPLPSNLEAEAAFLGAVMRDNALLDRPDVSLSPADFFELTHARIFEAIQQAHARGEIATPVTLRPHLESDEGLKPLGGMAYLARLTGDGQGSLVPDAFASHIAELATRRRRLEWLEDERAACLNVDRPLNEVAPPSEALSSTGSLRPLDLTMLAGIAPKPKTFILPRIAPEAEVTLFTGAGAVGKSLLGQQFATAIAAGTGTLGLQVRQAPAIYLTCEDDAEQLHWRQVHICKTLDVSFAGLAGSLSLLCLKGELENVLATFTIDGRLVPAPLFAQLKALIQATGAKLVCLDNVAHLFAGNENDRSQVTQFVNLLNRLAVETGAAILLMGHPNKGGDTYSGSTAWLNAVRSQVFMTRPEGDRADPDTRVLTIGKPNYTQAGEALRFRWHDWAFVLEGDVPASAREEFAEVSRANVANEVFLACLRERAAQGDGRAVGPNSGSNYAPTQFADMPRARGFDKAALKAAMERLFAIGKIEAVTVRNKAKARDVTIIREVPEASPNAIPNDPERFPDGIPNDPARRPNAARTIPDHTPSSSKRGGVAPESGPRPLNSEQDPRP